MPRPFDPTLFTMKARQAVKAATNELELDGPGKRRHAAKLLAKLLDDAIDYGDSKVARIIDRVDDPAWLFLAELLVHKVFHGMKAEGLL